MNGNSIKKEMIAARDEYISVLRKELLGPGSEICIPDAEHELISSSPVNRYLVGILYPQGNKLEDNNESHSDEAEIRTEEMSKENAKKDNGKKQKDKESVFNDEIEESVDDIGLSAQYLPSSVGITLLVKGNTDIVKGKASFATYRKAKVDDCYIPYIPEDCDLDKYTAPDGLSQFMSYDKKLKAFHLKSQISRKAVKDIVERDILPDNEVQKLKQIAYGFVDCMNNGFVREPHEIAEFKIEFGQKDYFQYVYHGYDDVSVDFKIAAYRKKIEEDIWSITIMFVNESKESFSDVKYCIFQTRLQIATDNNAFVFMDNNALKFSDERDEEEENSDLLYRTKKMYGTGLGTALDWNVSEDGEGKVWSEYFPISEIPPMEFALPENDLINDNELSMKYLSDLSAVSSEDKLCSLRHLVDLYKNWVDEIEKSLQNMDERYRGAASRNIEACRTAYSRMYKGIGILAENEQAYNAFMLANRAMFMQRVHLAIQNELGKVNADRYPGDKDIENKLSQMDYYNEDDNNAKWRPFQLAFLLMDIESLVNEKSEDRNLVDLIWFPTGGGKTEAYLGLTAFAIFYRRLAHLKEADGTVVIMRYTLRLLAAQQFTRAATLICACEYIRGESANKRSRYPKYKLGKMPVTIGLWIGGEHTPNRVKVACDNIKELLEADANSLPYKKERYNKFQVLKCPWCGTKLVKDVKNKKLLGEWGYMYDKKHFFMQCTHEDCYFAGKLPIQVVDEELYENPPTLLFGTVDKFAMLPWEGRTGAFFGSGKKTRAPELIVQDELHLISGSLGTMVGLYETAIDAICSEKGVSPKIIASTATICRAKEQCMNLYNRKVAQFPPPGIEASDSFFARESEINHVKGKYGRKYVGIFPAGKTKVMSEIRVISALLQRLYMMSWADEVKDKFWTLTAYYGSLKDLAKASTLMEDDVKDFIVRMANRLFASRRSLYLPDELTSRINTTQLNETLDKLERVTYSVKNRDNGQHASDILLATNMISVGIDIARLNVMVMVGQPKLASEYIQSSSRVGRAYPGVLFVQYDAGRARDRSHYENFKSYHDTFYKYVEPTSVTPFSRPARNRALHAVVIAIFRQLARMVQDKEARNFDKEEHIKEIGYIEQFIKERVENINANCGDLYEINDIYGELNDIYDWWEQQVNNSDDLCFGKISASSYTTGDWLLKPFNVNKNGCAKNTLTSMRNVDSPVRGDVLIWGDDNE